MTTERDGSVGEGEALTDIIGAVEAEVMGALESADGQRRVYGLVLAYSFIENVLKQYNFFHTVWLQCDEDNTSAPKIYGDELRAVFITECSFFRAIEQAKTGPLAKVDGMIERLHALRAGRNDIIHQLWVLRVSREDPEALRPELHEAADLCETLCRHLVELCTETGGQILPMPPA